MQLLGVTLLSRYKVEKVLGSGGFGDTYLARDTALPNQPFCVVKHLKPKTEAPEVQAIAQSLFEREAHMLYELGEQGAIPSLFAHFEQGGEFFLVQEFIEGHDLAAELPPNKIWPATDVKSLLQELLLILNGLHQKNVIHRDIKPQNIMRRRSDGKLFLIDFGAVKEIPHLTVTETGQTALTVAIGSPGYMPSEQAVGKPKPASDIYALGMIAIQALTGQNPTVLPTDPNTGDRIWSIPQDVSPDFAAFLQRMTKDHFSQRYRDAIEALQHFETLDQTVPTTVQPVSSQPMASSPRVEFQTPLPPTDYQAPIATPRRSFMPWILSGGGVIALGAGLAMVFQPWNSGVQVTSNSKDSSVQVNIKRNSESSNSSPDLSNPDSSGSETVEPVQSDPAPSRVEPSSPPINVSIDPPDFSAVGSALVIDPPSNVRSQPNGPIICAVKDVQTIQIGVSQGDWYLTNYCGDLGFIHMSQLNFRTQTALVIDPPSNVRSQPNGPLICAVPQQMPIQVFNPEGDWYRTNFCQSGSIGFIHRSQLSFN